jgi:hypothetical protein
VELGKRPDAIDGETLWWPQDERSPALKAFERWARPLGIAIADGCT